MRRRGALPGSTLSYADQALSSVSNFAAGLLIARAVGAAGYGSFAVALSVYVFALGVQRALVVEPMVLRIGSVGSHDAEPDRTVRYADAGLRRSRRLSAAAGGLSAALAAVAGPVLGWETDVRFALCLGVAVWLLLAQDYWRWRHLSMRRPGAALAGDAVFAVVELSLLSVLALSDDLTVASGLAAIALGAGAAAGYEEVRRRRTPLGEAAGRGRSTAAGTAASWLVAEFVLVWLSMQVTILMSSALLGTREAGVLRAATDLLGPHRTLALACVAVLLPRAARLAVQPGGLLHDEVRRTEGVLLALGGAYALAVGVTADRLVLLLYGDDFGGTGWVVRLTAVSYVLASLGLPAGVGLKAAGQLRALLAARAGGAVAHVTAAATATPVWGLRGAVGASVVGGLAGGALPWWAFRRSVSSRSGRPTGVDHAR